MLMNVLGIATTSRLKEAELREITADKQTPVLCILALETVNLPTVIVFIKIILLHLLDMSC